MDLANHSRGTFPAAWFRMPVSLMRAAAARTSGQVRPSTAVPSYPAVAVRPASAREASGLLIRPWSLPLLIVGALVAPVALGVTTAVSAQSIQADASLAAAAPGPGSGPGPLPVPGLPGASPAPSASPAPRPCRPALVAVRTITAGKGKRVSLTFDDGPGDDTGRILDILRAERVKATFFILGEQAQAFPAEVARVAAEGHALGNHTYDHPQLRRMGAPAQARQLDKTSRILEGITGQSICLMRPPYGEHNAITDRLVRQRGMEMVIWSVDTEDWKSSTPGEVASAQRILGRAKQGTDQPHPIILFHDGGGNRHSTAAVLRQVIAHYRSNGYAFTRVDGSAF